jgi:hypothetical protein
MKSKRKKSTKKSFLKAKKAKSRRRERIKKVRSYLEAFSDFTIL